MPEGWTPADVRAWVDRHGGPTQAAATLGVTRAAVNHWLAGSRPVSEQVRRHMELLDRTHTAPTPTRSG